MSGTDTDVNSILLETDEEEEYEEEVEEEPEVYFSADFISGPIRSEESTFTSDIFEFDYSFGYDCKRYYNLAVADEKTLVFASGNYLNFFDVETRQFWFRRSANGKGIGHLSKNPNPEHQHLAVAENGIDPAIIIYEWPSMDIVCFPNGMLLASQSSEPDFLITIFNWTKRRVVLRTKSNVNEVYRVMFSPDVPGQLTTCGLTHIKFWKMAETFTGLKLKGELGRFGKTEYCDILGIYPMPNEKVVSGCSWGNMLVWDEGLISVEVCQLGRKKCHDAQIMQFHYDNGDLWSVGMDGHVRVWFYDEIDQSDPPDYDRFVEAKPLFDFYTPDCMFMCIRKVNNRWRDFQFYAQDGNGGLWLIDLNTFEEAKPSVQLYQCHAGKIMDMAACPWGPYLASLGSDGRIQLYNYETQKLIFRHQYPAKGATLHWLPIEMQPSGDQLIMGFDDGNLRVAVLTIEIPNEDVHIKTIQITKPHNRPIVRSELNVRESLLVTAAEDARIFIFSIQSKSKHYSVLAPIGYIPVPGVITWLMWHPSLSATVMAGCIHGHFIQVKVPKSPQVYTTITYILKEKPIVQRFTTYKAQIRRNIKLAEIEVKKAEKREKKKITLEKLKADNPGMDIDEELFLEDSDSEEQLEPLHIPDIPNRVLWMQITPDDSIWLSMAGYDAGYIYEYYMNQTTEIPARYLIIHDGDDYAINNFLYSKDKTYLILAMEDGALRVVKVNPTDWRDLSDYWQLSMHDNLNGFISRMCFSADETFFFTCGYDGNIFSYRYKPDIMLPFKEPQKCKPAVKPSFEVEDVDGYTNLSLDEFLIKQEQDRINRIANEHKNNYLEKIRVLQERFQNVLKRNDKLLPTQIIPRSKFEIDHRITEHLAERFEADLALVERKLEYSVEKSKIGMEKLKNRFTDNVDVFPVNIKCITRNISVKTEVQQKLPPSFYDLLEIIEEKILEEERRKRPPERAQVVQEMFKIPERKMKHLEYFLMGLSPSTIERGLSPKLARFLHKYRERKERKEHRRREWIAFNAKKPIKGVNNPDDEVALAEAIETIGDFKLKTALNYTVPKHLRQSTVKKYKQLLLTRLRQYNMRYNLNSDIVKLRDEKVELIKYLQKLKARLNTIQSEIGDRFIVPLPHVPDVLPEDFPEHNLQFDVKYFEAPYLFERERIIGKMNNAMNKYDAKVVELSQNKIEVMRDCDLIDLHIISLNQELTILNAFESIENDLEAKVNANMVEMLDMQDEISVLAGSIDAYKREIEHLQEEEKAIQQQFLMAVVDNKFYSFLKRIFKKKYKPPKVYNPDESSSSSESSDSSESEQDAGSIDSRDFTVVRLDENVCPKGCDPALYDKTFELRTKRHGVELRIRDLKAYIEAITKEIAAKGKKLKMIDKTLKDSQKDLEAYQREKQKKMNLVGTTVILQLHQLQHLVSMDQYSKVGDVLLFCKYTLSQLYRRVGELHNETMLQKSKHKGNITHMTRMRTDCKHMRKDIAELKSKIKELMVIKFGQTIDVEEVEETSLKALMFGRPMVNIDDLEESVLRKMVFEFRLSQEKIDNLYKHEIMLWTKLYTQKQVELAETIKGNTARLDLLGVLNKEKAEMARTIDYQARQREKGTVLTESEILKMSEGDLDQLSNIVKNQNKELKMLRDEIARFKTKGFIVEKAKLPAQPSVKEEVIQNEDEFDWTFDLPKIEKRTKPPRETLPAETLPPETLPAETLPVDTTLLPMSTVNMAKSVVMELIDSIWPQSQSLAQFIKEDLVNHLIMDILQRPSVEEIAENIIALLPIEPTKLQEEIIQATAEQILSLKDPEMINKKTSSIIMLTKIIDEVIQTKKDGTPAQVVGKIVSELVNNLPIDFSLKSSTINTIVSKVKSEFGVETIDKEELVQATLNVKSAKKEEIQMIIDKILETLSETGLDYLYFIEQ
ncbi:hypothetical protein RI129_007340 [Pyrocoelia pectoralis]|uniref:Cilia- and flagella-associated protein 44 n=1 Tax=Pyrocoelia pectoralis TaxID=417401 RepID=A0AAN7V7R8_9COLE